MQRQWKLCLFAWLLCCLMLSNGFAQNAGETKYQFNVGKGRFDNSSRKLTMVVGEKVTLNLTLTPQPADGATKPLIYWKLAKKAANGEYQTIKEAENDPYLQLFKSESSQSTDIKAQFTARKDSYEKISQTEGLLFSNSVTLKAVRPIALENYRVQIYEVANPAASDPKNYIDIIVVKNDQVKVLPVEDDLAKADSYHLEAGTSRDFKVSKTADNSGNPVELYQVHVKSSDEGVLKVVPLGVALNTEQPYKLADTTEPKFRIIALNGPEPGKVREVTLTVSNQSPNESIIKPEEHVVSTIRVSIYRPQIVITPKNISLLQNSPGKVTVRLSGGAPGRDYAGNIEWQTDNRDIPVPVAETDGKSLNFILQSENIGDATQTATYKLKGDLPAGVNETLLPGATSFMNVDIRATAHIVTYEGPSTLLMGRTEKIKVTLYDQAQKPVDEVDRYRFLLEPVGDEGKKVVAVRRNALVPGLWDVTALSPGEAQLKVVVNGTPLADTWNVRVATVSEFKPVRVSLKPIDERMAADLFGKQTSKEFYVMNVRIFNNLDRDVDGRFLGKSILAYRSSIEASVGYEIKKSINFSSKKEQQQYESNLQAKRKRKEDLEKKTAASPADIKEIAQLEKDLKDLAIGDDGIWKELTEENKELIVDYSMLAANSDNPYPLGLISGNDAPQHISDAIGSGKPVRLGEVHEVQLLKAGQRVAFTLPEGVSISPHAKVHWWSENQDSTKTKIVTFENPNFGLAQINTAAVVDSMAIVSVVVGGKRYSSVIKIANETAKDQNRIQLYPVARMETGNNLVVTMGNKQEAHTLTWNHFHAGDKEKIGLIYSDKSFFVNGIVNGPTAIISDPKDNKQFAIVIDVELDNPATKLPPSVFIDAQGKAKYFRHSFRYLPYSYEMMINSLPERDRRDGRKRKFNLMNGLFSAASLYALAKPGNSTARRLSVLGGILPPLVESYYPDMTDAQRQNYVSMTMQPLEEIPFGADITRVLFFPKSPLSGMVKDHLTRINRIDTSYFNITVAILEKYTSDGNAALPGEAD